MCHLVKLIENFIILLYRLFTLHIRKKSGLGAKSAYNHLLVLSVSTIRPMIVALAASVLRTNG